MARACWTHQGTYTAGCFDCAEAARAYARGYAKRRAIANGDRLLVDVREEVLPRIRIFLAAGFNLSDIEDAAGVARSVAARINRGATTRIYPHTAQRLLSLTVTDLRAAVKSVPVTKTRRMLQHLYARGYSGQDIARRTGVDNGVISKILLHKQATLRTTDATAITRTFNALWNTHGPSTRARNHARREGWTLYLEDDAA